MEKLTADPRVTVRRAGPPDPAGGAVIYWLQRAQRATDNPALETAIAAANAIASEDPRSAHA
jgi:deoxyribodipyrimidine photo-lyase